MPSHPERVRRNYPPEEQHTIGAFVAWAVPVPAWIQRRVDELMAQRPVQVRKQEKP